MKTKRTFITAAVLVVLATLITLGGFRVERSARAQDQVPPPNPDRISFGMVGITQGQTIRITVSDTLTPTDYGFPPGPSRVVLNFRLLNGQLARDRNGQIIRKAVDLDRGDSTFVDLDFDQFPPGPTRVQLRAIVIVIPPAAESEIPPPIGERIAATVEVINNANGRTVFALSKEPCQRQLTQAPPAGE